MTGVQTCALPILIIAVEKSLFPEADSLLKAYANPNIPRQSDQASPLSIAVSNGNIKIVNLLLKFNANPNLAVKNGNTPFHSALSLETPINKEIIEALNSVGTFYRMPEVDERPMTDFSETTYYKTLNTAVFRLGN